MEANEEQCARLSQVRRTPHSPLALLSVDLGADGCNLDGIVGEVITKQLGLVSIVNTGLNSGVPRRSSAWPQFGQIRADGVCGGLVLYFHLSLGVEEMPALASPNLPGIWVTVAGLGEGGKEAPILVGILSCDQDLEYNTLEETLAEVVVKARERLSQDVAIVVGGNRALQKSSSSPIGLQSLAWSCPGPSQFLLHSPHLPLDPEPLAKLGGGALVCTLRTTGCPTCNLGFPSLAALEKHRQKPQHKRSLMLTRLQHQMVELTKSPHEFGLEVTLLPGYPNVYQNPGGPVEVTLEPGVPTSFMLQLKNVREVVREGNDEPTGVVVTQVAVPEGHWDSSTGQTVQVGAGGVVELSDEHGITGDQEVEVTRIRIKYSKRYKVSVRCQSNDVGELKVPVVVVFYHDALSEEVLGEEDEIGMMTSIMVVELLVRTQTPELVAMLPTEPFIPRPRTIEVWRSRETVRAQLPPQVHIQEQDYLVVKLPLGDYKLGEARKKLIAERLQGGGDTMEEQQQLENLRLLMEQQLNKDNYADRWQFLLHCEQHQEERDVRFFDMKAVNLKLELASGLLVVEVPGLAEGRPSLLRGDKLYIRESGGSKMVEYEGFVHQVGETEVWVGVSDRLVTKLNPEVTWDIRFTVSLHPSRHMHRAVKLAMALELTSKTLFPDDSCLGSSPTKPTLSCYNQEVAANPEQRAAVQAIVSGLSGPAPYIVFGPPGTGKTVTLVEAIKQVWLHHPEAHILATAPSNTATDLLAERLAEDIPIAEMIRLHANSRPRASVPSSIQNISNVKDAGYWFPPLGQLKKYKIIITTLVSAGRLVSGQFPMDHFKFVFIDEAGQATEPETVIALAGIIAPESLANGGQVVMAGDPWQLGPIVRSTFADQHGLATSLLERLMELPIYSRGSAGYDGRCITKLVMNFRSHPALLRLPARLFYSDELKAFARSEVVNSCLNWSGLTKRGKGQVPLLFHGVVGQDMREAASPSFFNPAEAVVVLDYIKQLVNEGVKPRDIGVITPYRRQVVKLRERLGAVGWRDEVMVGTTEEFQGQERMVILLSTVRSSHEFLAMDAANKLGFLANPKRFNVAVTRARALMVVVGNPHILEQDNEWRALLECAVEHGCYKGCPYPKLALESQQEQEQLSRLLLDQGELARLEETGWNPQPT